MAKVSWHWVAEGSHSCLLTQISFLQCIDGTESDDSDCDYDSYIDEEEALTDLLQSHLLDDELVGWLLKALY